MDIIKLQAIFSDSVQGNRIHTFPYIGNLMWLYELDELTNAARVPPIKSYLPAGVSPELAQQFDDGLDNGNLVEAFHNASCPDRWFQPEDAWKTINGIHQLLVSDGNEKLLKPYKTIREELADECAELISLLECAAQQKIKFKVDIVEMKNPPFLLKEWNDAHFAKVFEFYRPIIEEMEAAIKGNKNHDESEM